MSLPSSETLTEILSQYEMSAAGAVVDAVSSGLIHSTWKIILAEGSYILQRINTLVFKDPAAICNNSKLLKDFISTKDPSYLVVCPLQTKSNALVVEHNGLTYRLYSFVEGSTTHDVVESPEIAEAAAKSFGKLTATLAEFDCSTLAVCIPNFHNIALRYQKFEAALVEGNQERVKNSEELIDFLKSQVHIVEAYCDVLYDPNFKLRVTHHDTKISNVLFSTESTSEALCIIDLDTIMPGYFISDIGDMIRTYCCSVSEEESDFEKITFRDDIYYAILNGYLSEMEELLSDHEKECFIFAGKYMIYMQALRFLTDYLLDDMYYGAKYLDHNYVRAGNQAKLLKQLIAREPFLRENRFKEIL